MTDPKLHHYVPQFYLSFFSDTKNKFWVWDKVSSKVYRTSPTNVASQTHFYRIPEFIGTDTDPLILEKDLSTLEGYAANILRECIKHLNEMEPLEKLEIHKDDRWGLSRYLSVQFLRTAEQRDILSLIAQNNGAYKDSITKDEETNLHAYLLYSGGLVETIAEHIFNSIWIFAKNDSGIPLWTSDNPVAFKTGDNKMWLKGPGIFSRGSYAVFPLTPKFVLYCKEPEQWSMLKKLDSSLSPVLLTDEMVEHENSGQVFMATRHLISNKNEFSWAFEFVKSIGTDLYAPKDD